MEACPPTSVVCITPVRNEAWILPRFLACASLWADHIVIADQGSTDGSREIAESFDKVRLVNNPGEGYDEGGRHKLLIDAAREIPGRRLIVLLDADEALSANVLHSADWQTVLQAQEGTVIRFEWVNLLPGLESYWIPKEPLALAFMDDGSEYVGTRMHTARVPEPPGAPEYFVTDVKALHYQHANQARMRSKHRWYQCWERVHHPQKRPIQVFRQYHHVDGIQPDMTRSVDPDWFSVYEDHGVDMRSIEPGDAHWYDAEVIDWMAAHGVDRFRRLDIWDADWPELARLTGRALPAQARQDPRSRWERAIHSWLQRTQRSGPGTRPVRLLQRLLIPLGW